MGQPQFTEYEMRTRFSFKAMMWALSYPGRVMPLLEDSDNIYADLADSLLDLETSFYCEDRALLPILIRTGARHLSADRASYHFYPRLSDAQLDSVSTASIGTLTYPDQAATFFLGCTLGQGLTLKLSGPGIPPMETQEIQVDGIPREFWAYREKLSRFPCGWDVFLITDRSILGLPRTTRITIEE